MLYVLKDKKVFAEASALAWTEFMKDRSGRRVASDDIKQFRISTVFLGIDQTHGLGPFEVFETIVKNRETGDWQYAYTRRYETWEEAEDGHKLTCNNLKLALGITD